MEMPYFKWVVLNMLWRYTIVESSFEVKVIRMRNSKSEFEKLPIQYTILWKISRKRCHIAQTSAHHQYQYKAKLFQEATKTRHHFSLPKVIIQVQHGNGVLKRLVPCLKCMELACWVLQASLNLYHYLR